MAKKQPVFQYGSCVSCGVCAQACPISCIDMRFVRKQGKYLKPCPTLTDADCLGCGLCAKACPMEAISMEEGAENA